MAEYGGPVFPYIAFGGYPGERRGTGGHDGERWVPQAPGGDTAVPAGSEHTEAQALIITYSLNNFPRSDPRHDWVLRWESRFLEVLGDFQRAHPELDIAYMAEVKPPTSPPGMVGG